jgi:hypothetical protein
MVTRNGKQRQAISEGSRLQLVHYWNRLQQGTAIARACRQQNRLANTTQPESSISCTLHEGIKRLILELVGFLAYKACYINSHQSLSGTLFVLSLGLWYSNIYLRSFYVFFFSISLIITHVFSYILNTKIFPYIYIPLVVQLCKSQQWY